MLTGSLIGLPLFGLGIALADSAHPHHRNPSHDPSGVVSKGQGRSVGHGGGDTHGAA